MTPASRLRYLRYFCLIFASSMPVVAYLLPLAEGLTRPGQNALGIFAMAVILWVTSAVPLAVTGLVVLALLPLLKVMDADEAFALFGNPAVFFILGAFLLATALMSTGLSRRAALRLVLRFGGNPYQLMRGILYTCATLSCFMPMHAVAAIMFPIVSEIAAALRLEPKRSNYGTSLYLAMAWGCGIGGIVTLLGGARTPLAVAILHENTGYQVAFEQWTVATAPLALVLLWIAGRVLQKAFPAEIQDVSSARDQMAREAKSVGRLSSKEIRVAIIVGLTVLSWIFLGSSLGMATLSLLSAFVLFAFNTVTWSEAEENINWGVFLLYGGAVALGSALTTTGATEWLAVVALERAELSSFAVLAAAGLLTFVLTEFVSNAASVAVLLPAVLSVAQGMGIDPLLAMLSVAVPSGLAYLLPVGSPPNAIAFSSGFYRINQIIAPALFMAAVSFGLYLLAMNFYWPHLAQFWAG